MRGSASAKAPSFERFWINRSQLRERAGTATEILIGNPDISAIKRDSEGILSYSEGTEVCTVARLQLGDGVVRVVRNPYVSSIERDAERTGSHGKRAKDHPARVQLCYGAAVEIRNPHIGAIIGDAIGP